MNRSVAKKLCVFGNCGGNYDPMLSKWYKDWTEMIGKAANCFLLLTTAQEYLKKLQESLDPSKHNVKKREVGQDFCTVKYNTHIITLNGKISFLRRVAGLCLRDRVRSRAAAPPH